MKKTKQQQAKDAFEERLHRQREERARESRETQHRDDEEETTTPAPPRRFERFGHRLVEDTTSLRPSPDLDKVLFEKFGSRRYSAEKVQEAEERLHARLSGERDDKLPVDQRPEEVANPRCPVDGLLLQVVSYSASMKPAIRRCPACGRTEREMVEKGVSLESPVETLRASLTNGGLKKKPTSSPVEEHVRSLIRRW